MLEIKNLSVSLNGKKLLSNININIPEKSRCLLSNSTCFSSNTRHVVHAVLVSEEDVIKDTVDDEEDNDIISIRKRG